MTLSPGYGERFREDASRFDQGTADSMIHVPMAVAAMEQIAAWGVAEIAGSIEPLVDRIAAEAEERGWKVPPKRHRAPHFIRSEENTSELQSLMLISYAVVCLKKKKIRKTMEQHKLKSKTDNE